MLRSPLLLRVPERPRRTTKYYVQVLWRLLLVTIFVAPVLTFVASVHLRIWDASSTVGQYIYRLHDQVFLRIRGEIFRKYFPQSMTILTIVGIILLYILTFYILKLAPLRGLHFRVIQWLLKSPLRYPLALSVSYISHRLLGRSPYLMRAIALQLWETEVIHLAVENQGIVSPSRIRRLLALTGLLGKLTQYFYNRHEQLRYVEQVQFAALLAKFLLDPSKDATYIQRRINQLWARAYRNKSESWKESFPKDVKFDLLPLIDQLMSSPDSAALSVLQQHIVMLIQALTSLATDTSNEPEWRKEDINLHRVMTRISMNTAVQLALYTGDHQIALDYWELIEMTQYTIDINHIGDRRAPLHFLSDLLTDNNAAVQQLYVRHMLRAVAQQHNGSEDLKFGVSSIDQIFTHEQIIDDYWSAATEHDPFAKASQET